MNVWSIAGEGSGIISLMLTNLYRHLTFIDYLVVQNLYSLNEILLSSLLHPEWHGVCVEYGWRRTRFYLLFETLV